MINFKFSATLTLVQLLAYFAWSTPFANAKSEPDGTWLDGDLNWNQAGASLPKPPTQEGNNLNLCKHTIRPAVLSEDKIVESAGWTLTDSAQIYGATTIITGMADVDGMCRPLDYQVFVFTNGEFSGTLSPIPMDSRTDGSLFQVNLYREGFISAFFNRYQPTDALCCASGKSRLFYNVDTKVNPPVLVPQLPANTISEQVNQSNSPEENLTGVVWQLEQITYNNDELLKVDKPSDYTIEFLDNNQVQIKADCNRARGSYSVKNSSISIKVGATTRAMCSPESISDKYLNELQFATIFFFKDGNLYLDLKADVGTMKFISAEN